MKLFQKAVVGSIFILMRIQIQDPHWKKMEWIQILRNENVQTVLFFFFAFFIIKTCKPFRILYNLFLPNSFDFCFKSNIFCFDW